MDVIEITCRCRRQIGARHRNGIGASRNRMPIQYRGVHGGDGLLVPVEICRAFKAIIAHIKEGRQEVCRISRNRCVGKSGYSQFCAFPGAIRQGCCFWCQLRCRLAAMPNPGTGSRWRFRPEFARSGLDKAGQEWRTANCPASAMSGLSSAMESAVTANRNINR